MGTSYTARAGAMEAQATRARMAKAANFMASGVLCRDCKHNERIYNDLNELVWLHNKECRLGNHFGRRTFFELPGGALSEYGIKKRLENTS